MVAGFPGDLVDGLTGGLAGGRFSCPRLTKSVAVEELAVAATVDEEVELGKG